MISPEKVEAWTYQELPNGRYLIVTAFALYGNLSWTASALEMDSIPEVDDLPKIAANGFSVTIEEAYNAFNGHAGLWELLNDSLGSYAPLIIQ